MENILIVEKYVEVYLFLVKFMFTYNVRIKISYASFVIIVNYWINQNVTTKVIYPLKTNG